MKSVLVTGVNGQLGCCIKEAASKHPNLTFTFVAKDVLDIDDAEAISEFFRKNSFDYCINTAAYTNVEKAESEPKKAFKTNAEAVKNIAFACKENEVILIHISTDYVFDGTSNKPYTEEDTPNPINVYGASKLLGEQHIKDTIDHYFIFRTSWLYSQYGHNFFNTILKYVKVEKPLTITTEQTGTPTNANDLAEATLEVIASESTEYGVYNYCNLGVATWYDFAEIILENSKQIDKATLVKTNHYRTFAPRPKYSVLNTSKFCSVFNLNAIDWKESLYVLMKNINILKN